MKCACGKKATWSLSRGLVTNYICDTCNHILARGADYLTEQRRVM